MYPTTIIGLLLLFAAVRYAMRPESGRLLVVVSLGVMTFLSGCLGFVTGLIRTLAVATSGKLPEPVGTITAGGLGESLNNIGLALVLLVLASIATTIGALRASH
jgi:hypothetical protein